MFNPLSAYPEGKMSNGLKINLFVTGLFILEKYYKIVQEYALF